MHTRSSCPSLRPACAATFARLLLLLLLAARAFVPVGYMPDVQALKQGRLQLGFCAAGGGVFPGMPGLADPHTAHADASHDDHGHHDSSKHIAAGQECPFGLTTYQALLVPPAVTLVPALLGWRVQAPRLTDIPRPPM
ncbi:MAG TPA: hypothetical protein DCR74_08395, partial [Achromobacter sp.]|nr:hypothetical protein [Achromobacter sp.]